MKSIAIIETDRLRLRQVHLDDAESMAVLLQDPEIAENGLGVSHPYTIDDAKQSITKAIASENRYTWSIVQATDDALIGLTTLITVPSHSHGEIGYWIGKSFWDQGYATEAASAVIHFCFHTQQLHRVFARTFIHNKASVRVLEKLGMKREGEIRQHIWHEFSGEFKDLYFYGLLKSEYITP